MPVGDPAALDDADQWTDARRLSVISVSAQIGKVNENPDFEYAMQLVALENADNTGSVNDLLREGKRIPGWPPRSRPTRSFRSRARTGSS